MCRYVSWIDYLPCTDVKREVDPEFATEVTFRYNASLSARFKQTRLRLIVFMDNGASGNIRTASGSTKRDYSQFRPRAVAECRISDVVDAEERKIDLALFSDADAGKELKCRVKLRVIDDSVHDPSRDASGTTTVRLGKKIEGPIYKFPVSGRRRSSGVGEFVVRATEVMGESAYFRVMPEALLKM